MMPITEVVGNWLSRGSIDGKRQVNLVFES